MLSPAARRTPDADVSPEYRSGCGELRRLIERLVGTSRNVRAYIGTTLGVSEAHRNRLAQIYELVSEGVHHGDVRVIDLGAATDFVLDALRLRSGPTGWRAPPPPPLPSCFSDSRDMPSCRTKTRSSLRARPTYGW